MGGFVERAVNNAVGGVQNVIRSTDDLVSGRSNIGEWADRATAGSLSTVTGLSESDSKGVRNAAIVAGATVLSGGAIGYGLTASLAGTGLSLYAVTENARLAKEAADKQYQVQLKQMEVNQKLADAQNIKSIRAGIRQARAQAGQITNTAAGAGVAGSSGALGAAGSVASGMSGELSYLAQTGTLQKQSNALTLEAAKLNVDYAGKQATNEIIGAVGKAAYGWGKS